MSKYHNNNKMNLTIKIVLLVLGLLTIMIIEPSFSKDYDTLEVYELVGICQRTDYSEYLKERHKCFTEKTGTYFYHERSNSTSSIFNSKGLNNIVDITYTNVELMLTMKSIR
jgi:hypothetical protein